MSIKYRFLSMLIIPSLWVLVLALWLAHNRYTNYEETRAIVELSRFATVSSELIHELQKERGRSSGYFNSQGKKFSRELGEQRLETDAKLKLYNSLPASDQRYDKLNASRRTIAESLAGLESQRSLINQLQGSPDSAIGYYTRTIATLVGGIRRIGELVTGNKTIYLALNSYIDLIELKERTGITRAVYAGVFGQNSFSDALYRRAMELEGETRILEQMFRFSATPAYLAYYDQALDTDSVQEVRRIMQTTLDNPRASAFNVSPEKWFGLITEKIDLQKRVENHIAQDILKLASTSMEQEKQRLIWLGGLFALFGGISAWIYIRVYRGIVNPLRAASWMLTKLAKGDFNFEVAQEG